MFNRPLPSAPLPRGLSIQCVEGTGVRGKRQTRGGAEAGHGVPKALVPKTPEKRSAVEGETDRTLSYRKGREMVCVGCSRELSMWNEFQFVRMNLECTVISCPHC